MSGAFDWSFLLSFMPHFAGALAVTLEVFLTTLLLSTSGAVGMTVLGRSGWAPMRWIASTISWLFRGLPELIVLLFTYLGLPQLGLTLPPFWAAVTGLAAISMAYEYEIFRGALLAVPDGQFEAARALGMGRFAMYRRIIGPQVLRVALPPYLTFACTSLKRTSIASSVAVVEIMGYARRMIDALQKPFELMLIAMMLYAALSSILMLIEYFSRRRLAPGYPARGAG